MPSKIVGAKKLAGIPDDGYHQVITALLVKYPRLGLTQADLCGRVSVFGDWEMVLEFCNLFLETRLYQLQNNYTNLYFK